MVPRGCRAGALGEGRPSSMYLNPKPQDIPIDRQGELRCFFRLWKRWNDIGVHSTRLPAVSQKVNDCSICPGHDERVGKACQLGVIGFSPERNTPTLWAEWLVMEWHLRNATISASSSCRRALRKVEVLHPREAATSPVARRKNNFLCQCSLAGI